MILKQIKIRGKKTENYPLNFDFINNISSLTVENPITIICGENACGKSTLLKAIAHNHDAITVDNLGYVYENIIPLSERISLTYSNKVSHGFYFSSEDFISFIKYLENTEKELKQDVDELSEEFEGKSQYVKGLALHALRKSLYEIENFYGGKLNTKSHGEGYLAFFEARLRKSGLYFLDEPETPLSVNHQFQLAKIIQNKIEDGSQFIIVTHSPILLSIPGAHVLELSDTLETINYKDSLNYSLMEGFMSDPERFWHYYNQQ